jgi:predicted small lipoprotein YifL
MRKSSSRGAVSAPLILLLAACAVGPNYQPPDTKVAERSDSLDAQLYSTDDVSYENGASDFLQVLDAERTLLESEDRLARSRTEAATSLIALYKSLGGSWN